MKKIRLLLAVTILAGILTGCYRETIHNIMATAGTTETTVVTVPETYEGTQPWFDETTAPAETTVATVYALQPDSKWRISVLNKETNETYEIRYALAEDGKCYTLMSLGHWIFENGVGTYTINGNTLTVTLNGNTVVYEVDLDRGQCTLVSQKGDLPCQGYGDVYDLAAETKFTMEDIIQKAQIVDDEGL